MMSNAGDALKMFREVEKKSAGRNQKYSTYALLEICNTLFRMPWSEQLEELAQAYASKLDPSLSYHSIDPDDQASAHENLALFYSRTQTLDQANYHASIADAIDTKNFQPSIANAFIFLRQQRMALGRCIAGTSADIEWRTKVTTEKSEIITQDFLRSQYYHFWDLALVQTVALTSKETSCKQLTTAYQGLF